MIIVFTIPTNKFLGERAVLGSRMAWASPSGLTLASPTVERISDALTLPGAGVWTVVEGAVLAPPTLAALTVPLKAGAVEEASRVAGLGGAVDPLPPCVALALAILALSLLSTPWLTRRWKRKIHATSGIVGIYRTDGSLTGLAGMSEESRTKC